jgi:hypothetical protein
MMMMMMMMMITTTTTIDKESIQYSEEITGIRDFGDAGYS